MNCGRIGNRGPAAACGARALCCSSGVGGAAEPACRLTSRMSVSLPTSTGRSRQRSSSAHRSRRPSRSTRSLTTVSRRVPGIAHRDQPNGARDWVFRYRRDGKPHRTTLGKPDAVKADDARVAAVPSSPARSATANPFAFLLPARRSRRSPPSIWNGTRLGGSRPPRRRSRAISRAPSCPLSAISASARSGAPMSPASSTNTDAGSRAAARCGRFGEPRRGPAPPRSRKPAPDRGGAAEPADRAPVETGRMRGAVIILAIAIVVAAAIVVYFSPY